MPLLVLRDETERPEAVSSGCAAVVGTKRQTIVEAVKRLMTDELAYKRMQQAGNPFGDGTASHQIIAHLADMLAVDTSQRYSPSEARICG